MQIREFKAEDYPQVFALWKASGLDNGRSDSLESLLKQLERDADLFLVAEDDKRIVGVVLGRWEGRRGWINRLTVAPEQRHKKLGSYWWLNWRNALKLKAVKK